MGPRFPDYKPVKLLWTKLWAEISKSMQARLDRNLSRLWNGFCHRASLDIDEMYLVRVALGVEGPRYTWDRTFHGDWNAFRSYTEVACIVTRLTVQPKDNGP